MHGLSLISALRVLRRRWLLVVALPTMTALISILSLAPPPRSYTVSLAFAIDVPDSSLIQGSEDGTRARVAEAIVDDLSRIIGRDVFAAAVAARLPEAVEIAPGEIVSSLSAEDRHRIVELSVSRQLPADAAPEAIERLRAELLLIAEAALAELEESGDRWLSSLGEDAAALSIVDRPDPARLDPPGLRQRIELPLRVAIALALGLALAFALDAVDGRIYTARAAVSAAGAAVVGRIPRI